MPPGAELEGGYLKILIVQTVNMDKCVMTPIHLMTSETSGQAKYIPVLAWSGD